MARVGFSAAPQWHVTPSYRSSYEDLRAYSHAGSSVYSCKSSWHQGPGDTSCFVGSPILICPLPVLSVFSAGGVVIMWPDKYIEIGQDWGIKYTWLIKSYCFTHSLGLYHRLNWLTHQTKFKLKRDNAYFQELKSFSKQLLEQSLSLLSNLNSLSQWIKIQ